MVSTRPGQKSASGSGAAAGARGGQAGALQELIGFFTIDEQGKGSRYAARPPMAKPKAAAKAPMARSHGGKASAGFSEDDFTRF